MTLQLFVSISDFRHPERSEGPASALCRPTAGFPRLARIRCQSLSTQLK